jgi:hypothetical protein
MPRRTPDASTSRAMAAHSLHPRQNQSFDGQTLIITPSRRRPAWEKRFGAMADLFANQHTRVSSDEFRPRCAGLVSPGEEKAPSACFRVERRGRSLAESGLAKRSGLFGRDIRLVVRGAHPASGRRPAFPSLTGGESPRRRVACAPLRSFARILASSSACRAVTKGNHGHY